MENHAPKSEATTPPPGPSPSNEVEANARYLRASMDWVELRLRRFAEEKEDEALHVLKASFNPVEEQSTAVQPVVTPLLPVPIPPSHATRPFWKFWAAANAETNGGNSPSAATPETVMPEPITPEDKPLDVDSLAEVDRVTDGQIAEAETERNEAASGMIPAALRLAGRLGLNPFELDTLLLCAAPEIRSGFGALCARVNGVMGIPNSPFPTFAVALAALSDDADRGIVSPERPLRYWRLIEIVQAASQPLNAASLRAEERIVNALWGMDYLDDRLEPYLAPDRPSPHLPTPSQAETLLEILWGWGGIGSPGETGRGEEGPRVVQMLGPDTPTKPRLAARAAAAMGRETLYRLPLEQLPAPGPDLDTFARLALRECRLLPIALYLDAHRGLEGGPEGGRSASLRRFLSLVRDGAPGGTPVFLGIREAWDRGGGDDLAVEAQLPAASEQRDAWADALGPDAGDQPGRLAAQFRLDVPEIAAVAGASRRESETTGKPLDDTLWAACRDRVRPRLDAMAQRIDARVTLGDLVLPEEPSALLRQIAAQVGQRGKVYTEWGFAERSDRGLGISALFAGESGTGKTMAAEALANELALSLYRIDLSSVVSKYIGETEENLRKVFDAAEEGGVVLFFDEADALFGKRTEVKDSHDRYANIEVNYLLQRMEAYQGLAILATNRKAALDTAFLRRLRFLVQFPFPGIPERKRIWERAFPLGAPTEGLDFDRLARLALTGGNITSVALNAAFLAADAGTPVTMPLVLRAARSEFVKLERPVNEADFRL